MRYSVFLVLTLLAATSSATLLPSAVSAQKDAGGATSLRPLEEILADAAALEPRDLTAEEYATKAAGYSDLLAELRAQPQPESLDAKIDRRLLEGLLTTGIFEIEDAKIHEVVPGRYIALSSTSGLLLRPCAAGAEAIRRATEELKRLPRLLESARANLTSPAAVWTENAIVLTRYARMLLDEELPAACLLSPVARAQLLEEAPRASRAIAEHARWLEEDLLPRSTREPRWRIEQIGHYHREIEWLEMDEEEMLAIATAEGQRTRQEMEALAGEIHPARTLHEVWHGMKEEAPPWEGVLPLAEWYVAKTEAWLRDAGSHLLELPPNLDYGVAITTPMARRILSFGGASYGPTIGGRLSGYYVITPPEPWLSEDERLSRLRSYNPYWTHVISYHEWVGHNVQRALVVEPRSAVRSRFRSAYLSQAWSFYLEKLFEDEGYFDELPPMEALKTKMARLQMRMWRIQRIVTKLEMAQGTMTFDEAVEAYVREIGMERGNAFIEVQRDSQSPASPGREIIGERLLLEMWDKYQRRVGHGAQRRHFHESLLALGELPLPAIRALLFGGFDGSAEPLD